MDEPVKPHHSIIFWSAVAVLTIGYAAFNVWVYRYSKSGSAPSPKDIWQTVTKSGVGFQALTRPGPVTNLAPPETLTPTPRPIGPGEYACSAEGDCNLYSDEMRKGCPVTFADSRCLDSCGDASKRCSK